jgi:hypothetical protein
MKHIQTFVSAAICGFVLTLAGAACAQSTHPGIVTVVRIAGEARYSLGDGVWHPLVAGKILAAGAVIQTGHDATVDIVLGKKILMPEVNPLSSRVTVAVPDRISLAEDEKVRGYVSYRPYAEQNAIRMMGDTVLAIDKLMISDTGVDTISDTELDLRQGGIYNSVKKLPGASQYIIKIPNGTAGVRGTLFYINASGQCIAYKNSVVLSILGPDGKPMTVVVNEGYQFDPKNQGNGQPSSLPSGISPVPASLSYDLDQIFAALRTVYYGEVNFTFDRTQIPISPTTGYPSGQSRSGWWSWW